MTSPRGIDALIPTICPPATGTAVPVDGHTATAATVIPLTAATHQPASGVTVSPATVACLLAVLDDVAGEHPGVDTPRLAGALAGLLRDAVRPDSGPR